MIRHFLSLVILSAFLSSCGNNTNKVASVGSESPDQGIKVEFSSLVENPDNFVDKNIIVEGKVVHVCTHSGKKLFIVGENPDVRLFIAAGEDMPKFSMDLLGSEVIVEGHLTRLAATEPAAGLHEGNAEKSSGENCETEAAVAAQPALANIVMEYKKHTVK
jgi:hypothetical protein